jgi:Domain of unknown function (DUF1707)/Cell wall-active antibiotics response 4TMS YvqF
VNDPSDRVSDAEREQAVVALREELLAGRLTLDEFSGRVELAYAARSGLELASARGSLPQPTAERVKPRRRPTRFTGALFGRVVRRGRLRLRGWTVAISSFADVDLDLRQAEIDADRTAVTVVAAFGNVDVYVPEGVDVDVGGLTFFGHRREWGRDVARDGAPAVNVRVLGCFGTVDIWRVPSDMRGDYREIFRQLKEQERELPG